MLVACDRAFSDACQLPPCVDGRPAARRESRAAKLEVVLEHELHDARVTRRRRDRPKRRALDVAVGLTVAPDGSVRPSVARGAVQDCWTRLSAPLTETAYRGPTLVIDAAKENGLYMTPGALTQLRAHLGHLMQYVALDQPHTIPADAPAELAAAVARFIEQIPIATRRRRDASRN